MTRDELARKHCAPHAGAIDRLTDAEVSALLPELPGWGVENHQITKSFNFAGYGETMAFVNGVAWLAQREDHHPDLTVGHKRCRVAYSTHDVGGLSLNDFICAAKIEALHGI